MPRLIGSPTQDHSSLSLLDSDAIQKQNLLCSAAGRIATSTRLLAIASAMFRCLRAESHLQNHRAIVFGMFPSPECGDLHQNPDLARDFSVSKGKETSTTRPILRPQLVRELF